ncbi:MAG: hypothetical protein HY791_15575 [Deltaproteobacteria bacterium]|nr:hypothetical protein [Deltaproteobacteria bacterium]
MNPIRPSSPRVPAIAIPAAPRQATPDTVALSYQLAGASNPFTSLNVETALLEALTLQKTGADDDLRQIIENLRHNNEKKSDVRKLQGLLRQMETVAGSKDKAGNPDELAKLETQFRSICSAAGFDDATIKSLLDSRPDPTQTDKEGMQKWFGQMKDELDAMSQHFGDLGDEDNIRLQLALSKKSQFEQATSNSMKAMDAAANRIIGNIG